MSWIQFVHNSLLFGLISCYNFGAFFFNNYWKGSRLFKMKGATRAKHIKQKKNTHTHTHKGITGHKTPYLNKTEWHSNHWSNHHHNNAPTRTGSTSKSRYFISQYNTPQPLQITTELLSSSLYSYLKGRERERELHHIFIS